MAPETVPTLLKIALAAVLLPLLVGQCRKPRWWLGRFVVWTMNRSHSGVTDWGLRHAPIEKNFTILDVGCGGGRTVQKLAALASKGRVCGVDYSATSVAAAAALNRSLIETGRVEIRQASVSSLPFADGTFDLVTAVETHYYWPDLASDLREILRVLKPGGRVLIVAETYRGRRLDALYRPAMMLLRARYLTVDEHRDALAKAGCEEIVVDVDAGHGWICAGGRKRHAAA